MTNDGRRRIAAGALLLLLATAAFRAMPVWAAWRDAVASEALAARALLDLETAGLEGLPAMLDTTEARIARIREMGAVLILIDSAQTPESVIARTVKEQAGIHNVRIDSIAATVNAGRTESRSARDDERVSHVRIVGIEALATTDVRGLLDFLRALEEPAGPLRLRRLSITPDDVHVANTHPESIRVTIVVESVVLMMSDQSRTRP